MHRSNDRIVFINPDKTAILAVGKFPENINVIGKIEDSAKHLGVYVSLNYDTAYRLTYESAIGKMKNKAAQIFFSHRDNILKRKLIISTMLSSCVYHIMSVFLPCQKEGREIDKLTHRALWGLFTSKRYEIKISY